MRKPAKTAAKRRARNSSAVPRLPPVSPVISQRDSQHRSRANYEDYDELGRRLHARGPEAIADALQKLGALEEPPPPRAPRRREHPWQPSEALLEGIDHVNRLRHRAAKPDSTAALDAECAFGLFEWWAAIERRARPPATCMRSALSPGATLVVGALLRLAQQPPLPDLVEHDEAAGVVRRYEYGSPAARGLLEPSRASGLGLPRTLARLLGELAASAEWQRRIRRCAHAPCARFFFDTSTTARAVACSQPGHSTRVNEAWHQAKSDGRGKFVLSPRKRRGR